MKVEMNFNMDTLMAVNKQLQKMYELPFTNVKTENVYKSIGYDLADKFDKKCKTLIKKASLFDQKKRFKLTLKFHEAWALQSILMQLVSDVNNDYQKALIKNTINLLDQKTC